MLPEETYNNVCESLKTAINAMDPRNNGESLGDEEDAVIYKRLMQLTKRVVKQGKKAQKAKIKTGQP